MERRRDHRRGATLHALISEMRRTVDDSCRATALADDCCVVFELPPVRGGEHRRKAVSGAAMTTQPATRLTRRCSLGQVAVGAPQGGALSFSKIGNLARPALGGSIFQAIASQQHQRQSC